MKKISLVLVLLLSTFILNAQDYVFKVMASNGNVTLKATGKRLWAGSQINAADQLVLPANAYLGLIHKNGKTIELKQAGTYKVSELATKVGTANSSTTAKYVNYVVGEMSKADKEDINKNHRKYMAITGSVERGTEGIVRICLPETVESFSSVLFLKLYNKDPEAKYDIYEIKVLDMVNKEVAKYETKSSTFELDLAKLPYKYDQSWIIKVTAKGQDDPLGPSTYNVSLLKDGEKYNIVKKELTTDSDEVTALDKIIQAGVFEKEGLLADAVRSYEDAIKLQPEVDTYKIVYKDFLVRHKLIPLEMNPEVNTEEITKEEVKVENNK